MTVSLDGEEGEQQAELPDERDTPERAPGAGRAAAGCGPWVGPALPEHRQALVLQELQGLSCAEIGRALGLEDGQVPHLPGPVGLAQGNDFPGELFLTGRRLQSEN